MGKIYEEYQFPIIGGLIGLVLAILLLTIGFFKTLLVILLVLLGAYLGYYLNIRGALERFKTLKNRKNY